MALIKNLIFYCYINNNNIDETTQLHLNCLKMYADIFNGQKIIFISVDNDNNRENIVELFSFLKNPTIEFVKNNPDTRESTHFIESISKVDDNDSITFYCHNKGSTHILDESLVYWIHIMYFFNLYNKLLDNIEYNLKNHIMSGVLRKKAVCEQHGLLSSWHYSGAFFWINMKKIKKIENWRNIKIHRMGLEFYPSLISSFEDSCCSFCSEDYNFDMDISFFKSKIEKIDQDTLEIFKKNTNLIWKK